MNLQPVIKAKLRKFKSDYEVESLSDSIAFERFANQMVLAAHQPDAFSCDDDLLDAVCVGGSNDMGLDGICIKLNGILVHSVSEAQDIISLHKRADIELIFIQSKYKEKFDSGEYSKFINGITDFLSDEHFQPCNSAVTEWIKIKEYLMSEEVMLKWEHNPNIYVYYIVMGTWEKSPHIIGLSEKLKSDLSKMNEFGNVQISYVDTAHFNRLCDENENSLSVVLNIVDTFSLTEVNDVENSIIILCEATELMKLLVSEDGLMRRSLFNDNVRDYQGDTTINTEILDTIKNNPQSFVLLNNGITIVCDGIMPGNRKITIRNPQIVNGCQTCNVLYAAQKEHQSLEHISLIAKIIATHSDSITNNIVKGTNRQNIVYDEAFEITRPFHKELESFFYALSNENGMGLYYERRSKQFANNPAIKPLQRVNLRIILQSFVGIFLDEPNKGHRHESKLLQEYKNRIFVDTQSKLPYYVAPAIYIMVEKQFKNGDIPRAFAPYKMHISWVFKSLLVKDPIDINNEKRIDETCNLLLKTLLNEDACSSGIRRAVSVFKSIQDAWIKEKGESYRYGIKDSPEFLTFMKSEIDKEHLNTRSGSLEPLRCRGTVIRTSLDRKNQYYGYISRLPSNIFFHSRDNKNLDFSKLYGHDVLYTPIIDPKSQSERAVNVTVLK